MKKKEEKYENKTKTKMILQNQITERTHNARIAFTWKETFLNHFPM